VYIETAVAYTVAVKRGKLAIFATLKSKQSSYIRHTLLSIAQSNNWQGEKQIDGAAAAAGIYHFHFRNFPSKTQSSL
jgi:hypothetical protein